MDGDEFVVCRDNKTHAYKSRVFEVRHGGKCFHVAAVVTDDGVEPWIHIAGDLGERIMRGKDGEACDRVLGIMAAIDQAADFYWTCKAEYEGVLNEPE